MEFSTKVVETMAEIVVKEIERIETGDAGIMGLENNLRQLSLIGLDFTRDDRPMFTRA